MQTIIETDLGKFKRTAWTGGDTPNPEFEKTTVGHQLFEFFLNDQINDCGGIDGVKNCLMGDQTLEEKMSIFRNRAIHDAWATSKNPVTIFDVLQPFTDDYTSYLCAVCGKEFARFEQPLFLSFDGSSRAVHCKCGKLLTPAQ